MNIIFLDDDKFRQDYMQKALPDIYQAYSALDIIQLFQKINKVDVLFLDHDLGNRTYVDSTDKNTGAEVARWMIDNDDVEIDNIVIHSFNPVGASNIKNILKDKFNGKIVVARFLSNDFKNIIKSIQTS